MVEAAIGLGSNLGDPAAHFRAALDALAEVGELIAVSSVYETAPVGPVEQPNYLNAAVVIDTDLEPEELLEALQSIERSRGRQRTERWGPRTLDLDLLLYGDQEIDRPGLSVPHPRITERRFVLEPLIEAWPDATMPDGTPVSSFLPAVADQDVRRASNAATRRFAVVLFIGTGLLAVLLWWLLGLVF